MYLLLGPSGRGMPRSPQVSSSSSSRDDSAIPMSSTSSIGSGEADWETMQARAESRQALNMAEERARKAEKARLVEWFHGAALLEVCLFYWQHQLSEKLSDRRSIRARVAAQRCNLEDSDPSDMLATILPRLAREHATRLRADFATVDAMLKTGAQENDSSWIDTIGDRGDPPQHIFLQHMGRMVQANLCQCMDQGCAEALTTALLEKAQHRLYRPSMELLFPLLGKEGQLDFQQWFLSYSGKTAWASDSAAGSSTDRPPGRQ